MNEVTVKYDSGYLEPCDFSRCAQGILGICYLQLITFTSYWSCLGCFPGSGYETGPAYHSEWNIPGG